MIKEQTRNKQTRHAGKARTRTTADPFQAPSVMTCAQFLIQLFSNSEPCNVACMHPVCVKVTNIKERTRPSLVSFVCGIHRELGVSELTCRRLALWPLPHGIARQTLLGCACALRAACTPPLSLCSLAALAPSQRPTRPNWSKLLRALYSPQLTEAEPAGRICRVAVTRHTCIPCSRVEKNFSLRNLTKKFNAREGPNIAVNQGLSGPLVVNVKNDISSREEA